MSEAVVEAVVGVGRVCLDCSDHVPRTLLHRHQRLEPQKCISSQFWEPEIQGQGASKAMLLLSLFWLPVVLGVLWCVTTGLQSLPLSFPGFFPHLSVPLLCLGRTTIFRFNFALHSDDLFSRSVTFPPQRLYFQIRSLAQVPGIRTWPGHFRENTDQPTAHPGPSGLGGASPTCYSPCGKVFLHLDYRKHSVISTSGTGTEWVCNSNLANQVFPGVPGVSCYCNLLSVSCKQKAAEALMPINFPVQRGHDTKTHGSNRKGERKAETRRRERASHFGLHRVSLSLAYSIRHCIPCIGLVKKSI